MPLKLKPEEDAPRERFTFSPSPPATSLATAAPDGDEGSSTVVPTEGGLGSFEERAASQKILRPPADFILERDMPMLGARPLGDRSDLGKGLVSCTSCSRVVMEHAWGEHQRICRHVLEGIPLAGKKSSKNVKASDKEASKKRRMSEDSDGTPSAKRLALPVDRPVGLLDLPLDDEGLPIFKGLKKSDMKRLRKEQERILKKQAKDKERQEVAERKRMRISGPIDLNRHCGVINDKGLPCSRSLTCKTHTVGAKRAVAGRSRSYDELHLEWQREHNPNFKEPARRDRDKDRGFGQDGRSKGPGRKDGTVKKLGAGGLGLREEDRVVGEAELRDLISWTRSSAERCKLVIGLIGADGPGHGYLWNNAKIVNGASKDGTPATPGNTGADPQSGPLLDPHAQKVKAASEQARYTLCRPTSCNYTWTRQSEYENVGNLFVAALKARPLPKARPHGDEKARETKKKSKAAKTAAEQVETAPASTTTTVPKITIPNPAAAVAAAAAAANNALQATPIQAAAQLQGTPKTQQHTPRMPQAQIPSQGHRAPTPQQQQQQAQMQSSRASNPINNDPAALEQMRHRMQLQQATAAAQVQQHVQLQEQQQQQQQQQHRMSVPGPAPGMRMPQPIHMQFPPAVQNLPSFQAAAANMQQGMPQAFPNDLPPNIQNMTHALQHMQNMQGGMTSQQQQQALANMQNMQNFQGMQGMQGMPGMQGMQGMQMGGQGWPQVQQGVEG